MATTRLTGIVSRFSNQKGYGFIKPDNGSEDVFVHQSEIKSDGFRSLYEGQKVEFTVTGNGDKYQAVDVTGPNGESLDGNVGARVRVKVSGNGSKCYNCGRIGHVARDCDGDRNDNGGGGACYTCGMTGHIARDCDRIGGVVGDRNVVGGGCYNCGGFGHMARDCPSERRGGGGGGGNGGCYNCGLPGHLARDCSRESGGGGNFGRFGGGGGGGDRFGRSGGAGSGKCYNCGEGGHFARECTSPAVK